MKTAAFIAGFASVLLAASTKAQAPLCTPSDGDSIKDWMQACDSVAGTAAKCADTNCHTALHRLEEEETHECWEFLGLGSHLDFDKYIAVDAFCHGEGPDPETTPAPTTKAPTATMPPMASTPKSPSTPNAPVTPRTSSTPAPSLNESVPAVTPKPQC